jgi:1-acyl-sn-glycerol-3-phosphate acyltransferase
VVTVEPGQNELEQLATVVVEHLRGRRGLLLFPEGGVQDGVEGELRPLHTGAVRFAMAARVPLVPAAVSGTAELWWGKQVRLALGAPLATADLEALSAEMRALFAPVSQPTGSRRARWLTGLLR